MSDVNHAAMSVFFEDLAVRFTDAFNAARPNTLVGRGAAMEVPSMGEQMVHGWLNQIAGVREWLGDRQVRNIQSDKLTIVNRKFEETREMERTEIEDDKMGLYAPLAAIIGRNAAQFQDELICEALFRGTTDTWADDVAIFSNAGRTYGSNTIDNYATDEFDEAGTAFNTAVEKQASYLGHDNKPLKVQASYLLHGPALRVAVGTVLGGQYKAIADAGTTYVQGDNVNQGLVVPIELPYFVDGYVDSLGTTHNAKDYWFLLGVAGGIPGVFYQNRVAPEFQTSRLSDDSDFVFENDKYQYGTRFRGAGFVGLPHCVYGSFADA